jgi:PAS domain S-box-containing protein
MSTQRETDLERRLFELVRDALVVAGADGTIHRVNAGALDLTGLDELQCIGRSLDDLVDPGDRAALHARLEEALGAGRTIEPFTARFPQADGSQRWAELTLTADPEGPLVYVVARDVTGHDELELERLIALFADAPMGMALLAPDGSFLRVNATLCRMLGRSEEELLELTMFQVVEDDPEGLWGAEPLRDAVRPSFQAETRMLHPEGRRVSALMSANLVRGRDGEPHYYVCQLFDITERNEAQERLAANEAKLAEAQQIARLGSWEWEIASDRVTWSDELYRIYGVRPDRFPGSYGSYLDKVHADDRARVARVIETAVAERKPWSLDYRIVRPDDDVRLIHARGEVVLDEQGRPAVVHGTCQDVTENRRVEDALRAAEQLFRRAFDDAPIGMALIDLEGRWLRLNRSLCQIFGRSEQDLRTVRLEELGHPEDRALDAPLVKELLAGRRRSYAIEKRYLHADGRILHALMHVSLMHGDGERPLYFLCQLVDVTERRRAEAERRAGEERLQAIIDNSPALIMVTDTERRYLLVNRRWEETFGVRAEQAIGRSTAELAGEVTHPDHHDLDDAVAAAGAPMETTTILPGPDGDELTFIVSKFPLRDAEGRVYAVCTIATDITERVRSAEERAELEHRLAQAQRLESVGQLAGGVAHDFNNLLSVILTCVGFAQRELAEDHPVRDDVEEIGRAADRAAALTRQLLMFSRREVARPEVLDAGTLVRDLERLLNRTLSERVALRIAVGPDVVPILADRAQLEQVLVNLAVNARDAMPQGGTLSIAVGATATAGGDPAVRITVADDGTGMPAEVRDRAFEPFFTTKAPGDGTGLGLATVHGIVTDSGGTVEIDSAPGSGTVVTIVLPASTEGAVAAEEPGPPGARASGEARVMVVEDQDPVRRQACRVLRSNGYEVFDAPGADEALAEWPPVDVLVTDVVMPGMTGHQLAEIARQRNPELRVVFMSGHTEDVLVRNGARSGDLAFVQKPFTSDSLLQAVEAVLAAPPEAAGAAAER